MPQTNAYPVAQPIPAMVDANGPQTPNILLPVPQQPRIGPTPARKADNARTNVKRRVGTKLVDQVQRGPKPTPQRMPAPMAPSAPNAAPAAPPQQQTGLGGLLHRLGFGSGSGGKGFDYLAMGLSLLFPGAPIGSLAAGYLSGKQQGRQQEFENRMAAAKAGVDPRTGAPIPLSPLPGSMQQTVPGAGGSQASLQKVLEQRYNGGKPFTSAADYQQALAQAQADHYNTIASFADQQYMKTGDDRWLNVAQDFTSRAANIPRGYEELGSGSQHFGSNATRVKVQQLEDANRLAIAHFNAQQQATIKRMAMAMQLRLKQMGIEDADYRAAASLQASLRRAQLAQQGQALRWNMNAQLQAIKMEYEQTQQDERNSFTSGYTPPPVSVPQIVQDRSGAPVTVNLTVSPDGTVNAPSASHGGGGQRIPPKGVPADAQYGTFESGGKEVSGWYEQKTNTYWDDNGKVVH